MLVFPTCSKLETFAILLIYAALYQLVHKLLLHTLPLTSSTQKLVLPIAWSHQHVITKTMIKLVPSFPLLNEIQMAKISEFSN